ncbi:MFS transporter [Haladaptatus sp. NG-SE-30]
MKDTSESTNPDSTHAEPPTDEQTPDESASVPWRSSTVQVVLLSTVLAPLGVPLVSPALPVIRDAFGVTNAEASLLVSAYFVTGIVLSPFIGLLADRVGRRRVLIPSLLLFSLTGGAMVFAPSFELDVALRVVQGTAAAGIFITTVTLVGDVFDGTQRNAVLGVNIAALSAGAALFPIVGGALAAISWNAPFVMYLAALPVALFAAWVLEEPAAEHEAKGLAYLRGAFRSMASTNALVLYGAAFATEVLLFGAIITGLPFLLTASYAIAPVFVGLVLTASEVSSTVVSSQNGRFAKYLSNYQLIALSFGCYGVGLVGAWLASSPVLIAVAVGMFGAGVGLSMPAVDAAISDLVETRYRGGALSLRNSTTFLGRATGPILFTGIAAIIGYESLLFAAGVVALTSGLLVVAVSGSRSEPIGAPEEMEG